MSDIIHEKDWLRVKKTRHGVMAYNINDAFIGRSLDFYGEWCMGEFENLDYANKVVVDVGANIGTHTLEFAKKAKHVYSFEPQKQNYDMLVTNVTLNALTNVWHYREALSNEVGWAQVGKYDPSTVGNFGACEINESGPAAQCCPLDTISDFMFPPDLIKIDVEGHEYEVLQGAKETIAKHRPVLYVECDREDQKDRVIALIESYGYEWQWDMPWLFNPANFFAQSKNIFSGIWSEMLLCHPKEKEHVNNQTKA